MLIHTSIDIIFTHYNRSPDKWLIFGFWHVVFFRWICCDEHRNTRDIDIFNCGSAGLKCTSSWPAENRDRELWSDWPLTLLTDSHWLGEKRKFTNFLTKYTQKNSRDNKIQKKIPDTKESRKKEKKERHKDETSTNNHLQKQQVKLFLEI